MNADNSESNITNEILDGGGLSLTDASRVFPSFRSGSPVRSSTVFRWIMDGVRLRDGGRLRLEARRVGGRWLTSRGAIARFIEAQSQPVDDPKANPIPLPRTPTRRAKAAARAGEKLKQLGI